jgi:hypothetical protein
MQQIGFPFESVQPATPWCTAACRFGRARRRSKSRVLEFHAALAKTVRGVEPWTYLWWSSSQRCFLR